MSNQEKIPQDTPQKEDSGKAYAELIAFATDLYSREVNTGFPGKIFNALFSRLTAEEKESFFDWVNNKTAEIAQERPQQREGLAGLDIGLTRVVNSKKK